MYAGFTCEWPPDITLEACQPRKVLKQAICKELQPSETDDSAPTNDSRMKWARILSTETKPPVYGLINDLQFSIVHFLTHPWFILWEKTACLVSLIDFIAQE